MRQIEGTVCLVKSSDSSGQEYMLGPKTSGVGEWPFERIKLNGLVPFPSRGDCRKYLLAIRQRYGPLGRISLAKIRLDIAQNEDDLKHFPPRGPFIIVAEGEKFGDAQENFLLGKATGDSYLFMSTLPLSELEDNGFVCFTDRSEVWEGGYNLVQEARRQGHTLAWPATFSLTRLKSR